MTRTMTEHEKMVQQEELKRFGAKATEINNQLANYAEIVHGHLLFGFGDEMLDRRRMDELIRYVKAYAKRMASLAAELAAELDEASGIMDDMLSYELVGMEVKQ